MNWIQAAGAKASVEYKENGGGTHLPSVPEIHFKLEIKEQKKKKTSSIFSAPARLTAGANGRGCRGPARLELLSWFGWKRPKGKKDKTQDSI